MLSAPTLSLCRFAVGSALADLQRDIILAWLIFQPQSGVSADAGNGLRGVMGTRRRGDGAVQSWVKPEVDPPRVCALPRGSGLNFSGWEC